MDQEVFERTQDIWDDYIQNTIDTLREFRSWLYKHATFGSVARAEVDSWLRRLDLVALTEWIARDIEGAESLDTLFNEVLKF